MSICMAIRSASKRHGWRSPEPLLVLLCFGLWLATEVWMSPVFAQPQRRLDGFENLALWQVGASDGVRASLRAVEGFEGQALCLDFDFAGVAGYASVHHALPIDL